MDFQNSMVSADLNIPTSQFTSSELSTITSGAVDNITNGQSHLSCWDYWRDYHYPQTIVTSYPVYIQERAKDKGKQAYEIIKVLKDKKLVDIKSVGKFIDLMDELIKIL